MPRMVSTTVYLTYEQHERLHHLSEQTKVPFAVFVREGVDLLLKSKANEPVVDDCAVSEALYASGALLR